MKTLKKMLSIKSILKFLPGKINGEKKSAVPEYEKHNNTKTASDKEDLPIFKKAMDSLSEGVIITEAGDDQKIIYVNKQFLNETGYTREEMLGRNPRFLQGEKSDSVIIKRVKEAIQNKYFFRGEIINYRKNG